MNKQVPAGLEMRGAQKLVGFVVALLLLAPMAPRVVLLLASFDSGVMVSPIAGIWLVRVIGVENIEWFWYGPLDWGTCLVMGVLMSTGSYLRQKVTWARWTVIAGYSLWGLNSVAMIVVFLPQLPDGLAVAVLAFECGSVIAVLLCIPSLLGRETTQWLRTPDEPQPLEPVRGQVVVGDLTVDKIGDTDRPAGETVGQGDYLTPR